METTLNSRDSSGNPAGSRSIFSWPKRATRGPKASGPFELLEKKTYYEQLKWIARQAPENYFSKPCRKISLIPSI